MRLASLVFNKLLDVGLRSLIALGFLLLSRNDIDASLLLDASVHLSEMTLSKSSLTTIIFGAIDPLNECTNSLLRRRFSNLNDTELAR